MLFNAETLNRIKKAMAFANQVGNPSAFNKLLAQYDADTTTAPTVHPINARMTKVDELNEPGVHLVAAR